MATATHPRDTWISVERDQLEDDHAHRHLEQVRPDIAGLAAVAAALIVVVCGALFSLGGATGPVAAIAVAGLSGPVIILGLSWYAERARNRYRR